MRVLFVCTGNICRSPVAERLFLARAEGRAQAGSAGTGALVGRPVDPSAALVARELGADPSGHRARDLTALLVAEADLVLTATRAHRDQALALAPRAHRRTFTLREFARLGAGLDPADAGDADDAPDADLRFVRRIAEVAAERPYAGPGPDDIGDPFGGPLAEMRRTGAQLADSIDAVLAVLGLDKPS